MIRFWKFLNDKTEIQTILTLALSADKSDEKIDLFKSLLLNVDIGVSFISEAYKVDTLCLGCELPKIVGQTLLKLLLFTSNFV